MSIDLLKECLDSEKTPILFLGAGFSDGAINSKGNSIPKSSDLKEMLLAKFVSAKDHSVEDYEQIRKMTLQELCTYIADFDEKKKISLFGYLTTTFKGTRVNPKKPYHKKLVNYPWRKIYTLNIDDLVENIYNSGNKTELIVQNEKKRKVNEFGYCELLKLHGCVNNPNDGYIFSLNQYAQRIIKEDYRTLQFSNDYFESDIIFLGTELNENDINIMLKKYENAGYSKTHRCFFVSPKIGVNLSALIRNTSHYYHINMNAERFLDLCNDARNEWDQRQALLSELKQFKFWNIDEFKNVPKHYVSNLYYGDPSNWSDVFSDWDIINQDIINDVYSFVSKNNYSIISIFGKAYTGKSVCAKRIITSLIKNDYSAYQFDFQSRSEINKFLSYLRDYQENPKVALLVEDAAMQYHIVNDIISSANIESITHFVIVTVSRDSYHNSKAYELNSKHTLEIGINGDIDQKMSESILDKLIEKNRTSDIRCYADNKREQLRLILSKKNLVNFLYFLTHGEAFEEVFKRKKAEIRTKELSSLFSAVCIFSALGVEEFPSLVARHLFADLNDDTLKHFEDIIDVHPSGGLKLRWAEYFHKEVRAADKNVIIDLISKTIELITKMFTEDDNNEWSSLFQKLLKFSNLRECLDIEAADIVLLLDSIEDSSKEISYYWMQRGLAQISCNCFAQANVYLSQAKAIRPNSFKIEHALANNKMQWGLSSGSREYFNQGERQLNEIIDSNKYSNAICYAVHTLVVYKLKSFEVFRISKIETSGDIRDLCGKLIRAILIRNDSMMRNAYNMISKYCARNSIDDCKDVLENVERDLSKTRSVSS